MAVDRPAANAAPTRANSQANHVCAHCSLREPAALAITNTELDEMGRMVEVRCRPRQLPFGGEYLLLEGVVMAKNKRMRAVRVKTLTGNTLSLEPTSGLSVYHAFHTGER